MEYSRRKFLHTAGSARVHHLKAVPVIRCANDDDVDVLILKKLAIIGIRLKLEIRLFYFCDAFIDDIFINITDGHYIHFGNLHERLGVRPSHAVHTDNTDIDAIVLRDLSFVRSNHHPGQCA